MVVLFGSDFGPAAEPFAILLPGAVCLTLWYVLGLYILSSLHRPGTTTLIQGLAFVISAPLYWIAVQEWGLNGAAMVSTLTYAAVFAAGLIILERSPHVSWRDLVPTHARRPPHGRPRAARARRAARPAPRALPLA